MTEVNRSWRLAARPQGMIKDSDFTWHEEPLPAELGPGQILVETLYLSVDPTQRIWMERDSYLPAVGIGEVMRAGGVGRVVRSSLPGFSPGDLVYGMTGWQTHAVIEPSIRGPRKLPDGVPPTMAVSLLGLTGLTAYFGLLDVGSLKDGETVVVSGAAGATGNAVGQIAKIKGCRVVGIAGGPEKCAWIKDELGFDAAIDYKAEDVYKRLGELCPNGIDVYFDNVGGLILEAALSYIALRGRVVLCGSIGDYNNAEAAYGPNNLMNLVLKRGRMEGFIVTDYAARFGDAIGDLARWAAEGRIKDRVDVVEGLSNAPAALRRLFTGANTGKQLVKVAAG
ncbi:NADP-dependent oxidoreductase [Polyangium jinanense]|uniref:NADP-dependent oxidoreductase n=1 Tax=Polyangium jinanense TaxID=2829994 RepID=A0A9X3XHD1_9BACT|nr:NADP-dependent oxidoreductase [Polyangium jinanense]MDC3960244.1 NADP-dependent oxidoreductase [Polyangium jinanense]MDC3988036.1 NADP-dependent oxidoreductase [Polyangium jinanense]